MKPFGQQPPRRRPSGPHKKLLQCRLLSPLTDPNMTRRIIAPRSSLEIHTTYSDKALSNNSKINSFMPINIAT